MAGDKGMDLLQQLINATREGKVTWHPTAKLNEFTTSFKGRFSVLVGKESTGRCYFRVVDGDDHELLAFLSPLLAQDMVSSVWGGQSVRTSPLVSDLHHLALRNALRVDQAIDEILEEIRQG